LGAGGKVGTGGAIGLATTGGGTGIFPGKTAGGTGANGLATTGVGGTKGLGGVPEAVELPTLGIGGAERLFPTRFGGTIEAGGAMITLLRPMARLKHSISSASIKPLS
jgi:hypothetical protein